MSQCLPGYLERRQGPRIAGVHTRYAVLHVRTYRPNGVDYSNTQEGYEGPDMPSVAATRASVPAD